MRSLGFGSQGDEVTERRRTYPISSSAFVLRRAHTFRWLAALYNVVPLREKRGNLKTISLKRFFIVKKNNEIRGGRFSLLHSVFNQARWANLISQCKLYFNAVMFNYSTCKIIVQESKNDFICVDLHNSFLLCSEVPLWDSFNTVIKFTDFSAFPCSIHTNLISFQLLCSTG